MTNIFDILTDMYDAWYDSEEGYIEGAGFLCIEVKTEKAYN